MHENITELIDKTNDYNIELSDVCLIVMEVCRVPPFNILV